MDRAAFDRCLQPLLGPAFGYALRLCGDRDEAMDLVQEASVNAFRAARTFQPGTNFRAWYFRILTNVFYRSRRKPSNTVSLDDEQNAYLLRRALEAGGGWDGADRIAEAVMDGIDAEAIQDAIRALPDEYRSVAMLYFLETMKYEEIADALGLPLGTVRSRLHRGRKALQRALWDVARSRGIEVDLV
ncbi:MAG: sigma-70 family RNA polymerase sigma factor [Fimbriimonadaceae bacterium]|nr:sigma-70 family RNA polymerase sigma factor [Fimbriimonadaceae bacterium]